MSIKIISSIDGGGGGGVKSGRGEGDGGFNISPAQEEIGVTIQNTPTRNFFKNHFIGATLSETICFHGNSPGFCACVQ